MLVDKLLEKSLLLLDLVGLLLLLVRVLGHLLLILLLVLEELGDVL